MKTTILLGIVFESYEVLDILISYFAQLRGNFDFQLPMSLILFKFIQISVSDDGDNALRFALVDSTHHIRALCPFQLEDMGALAKRESFYWKFLKNPISTNVST